VNQLQQLTPVLKEPRAGPYQRKWRPCAKKDTGAPYITIDNQIFYIRIYIYHIGRSSIEAPIFRRKV
jgi:hypothetical protein